MRTSPFLILTFALVSALTFQASAQQTAPAQGAPQPAAAAAPQTAKPSPKDTEVWEPVPPIVTPGTIEQRRTVRRDRPVRRQQSRSVGVDQGQVAAAAGRSPTA